MKLIGSIGSKESASLAIKLSSQVMGVVLLARFAIEMLKPYFMEGLFQFLVPNDFRPFGIRLALMLTIALIVFLFRFKSRAAAVGLFLLYAYSGYTLCYIAVVTFQTSRRYSFANLPGVTFHDETMRMALGSLVLLIVLTATGLLASIRAIQGTFAWESSGQKQGRRTAK